MTLQTSEYNLSDVEKLAAAVDILTAQKTALEASVIDYKNKLEQSNMMITSLQDKLEDLSADDDSLM